MTCWRSGTELGLFATGEAMLVGVGICPAGEIMLIGEDESVLLLE